MRIIYTENNTKICNSRLIENNEIWEVVYRIMEQRKCRNLLVTRTQLSYCNEIKAHNRLYKLGLFKSHTKDVDLEEPIKKWKEILYSIIK